MTATVAFTCDWCDQPAVLRLLQQHLNDGPWSASWGHDPRGPLDPQGNSDFCIAHARALTLDPLYEDGKYVSLRWRVKVLVEAE